MAIKKGKKGTSPYVGELRDSTGMSTENHYEMTRRLMAAGLAGIHGKPGARKPKKG